MGRFIVVVVLVTACTDPFAPLDETGSESSESVSPCERVRDHLIELRLEVATLSHADVVQHRAAMRQAMGNEFVETCASERQNEQVQCALDARDFAAANACLTTASGATH
jgi:hypothetical protein